jgi:Concanavalin A-like lectin/glucanases superfamily
MALILPSNPSVTSLMLFAPVPIERYMLTSCNVYREFPSIYNATTSLLGPLLPSIHAEFFRCDPMHGLSFDLDWIEGNSTSLLEQLVPKPMLETKSTFMAMGQRLNEKHFPENVGFTVATWFTPTLSHPKSIQPIVTVGGKAPTPTDFDYRTGCPGHDLMISQFQKTIYIQYTSSDLVASGFRCHHIRAFGYDLDDAVPTHVAVVFDATDSHIYVNGNRAVSGIPVQFDTMMANWNATDSNVQLLASYTSSEIFRGSIHQVDFFDQALNKSQVAALYDERIIQVSPSLLSVSAKIDEESWIRQDANETLSLHIGSWNASASVFNLEVELVSLPQHGILSYNGTQITAKTRRRFPIGFNSTTITFDYRLTEPNYFSFPSINMYGRETLFLPEFFDFRIRAYNFNRSLIALSPTTTQPIQVIHVNHPGHLAAPNNVVLDIMNPMTAIVPGPVFYNDTLDYDMDYVRVDVWADYGLLSMSTDGLRLADFDSCKNRVEGEWQCIGDGIKNSNMTFMAIPSDVRSVLRYLSYERSSPTLADEINIRVSDGTGAMCLSQLEHNARMQSILGIDSWSTTHPSFRDECFQTHAIIPVPGYNSTDQDPLNPNRRNGSNRGGFLGFLSIADLIFWGLICAVIAFCILCCRQLPRCSARGRAVDVDNSVHSTDDDPSILVSTTTGEKGTPLHVVPAPINYVADTI